MHYSHSLKKMSKVQLLHCSSSLGLLLIQFKCYPLKFEAKDVVFSLLFAESLFLTGLS